MVAAIAEPPDKIHSIPLDDDTLTSRITHVCKLGSYRQVCEIQRLLMRDMLSPATEPADRSACARAFDLLEERKRILKMKFKPGDLRASDLDPVRQAWHLRNARKANAKHLGHLPAQVFLDAEIVAPAKALPAGPAKPLGWEYDDPNAVKPDGPAS